MNIKTAAVKTDLNLLGDHYIFTLSNLNLISTALKAYLKSGYFTAAKIVKITELFQFGHLTQKKSEIPGKISSI